MPDKPGDRPKAAVPEPPMWGPLAKAPEAKPGTPPAAKGRPYNPPAALTGTLVMNDAPPRPQPGAEAAPAEEPPDAETMAALVDAGDALEELQAMVNEIEQLVARITQA